MKTFSPRLLIAAVFLFFFVNTSAQPTPVVEWQKCLGSNYGEYATCIQLTSDGGYIVAGVSYGADNGDVRGHHGNAAVADVWVIKMDRAGKVEWQKSLGGEQGEDGAYIIQTPDGGYILAGGTASSDCSMTGNHGGLDMWVVRLNSKGDITWQKMYGGSRLDEAHSIAMTADGGYFVSGVTRSQDGNVTGNHGGVDSWVIKIDATGNLIWQKALGGSGFDEGKSIKATADGGCVVGGITSSDDGDITGFHGPIGDNTDYWIVKLDNNGAIQWQKALGGSREEVGGYIQVTNDGGYIVAGNSKSTNGDVSGNRVEYDAWIVKLDATGNLLWEKSYGGPNIEFANNIQNTPDGGHVFTGSVYSSELDLPCNAGLYNLLVTKINSTGVLEWQKLLGGSSIDDGLSVQALNDGSFVVAGYTRSPEIPGYHEPADPNSDVSDYWIVKLSAPRVDVPVPVVKIDPASAIICAGSNKATLTASALYAGARPFYQWTKNGTQVGTNSTTYTDLNITAGDQVGCTVRYGNICDNNAQQGSDVVTIKLKNAAQNPEIKIAADNIYVCNCTTVNVTATISNGGTSPSYQWMVNGNNTGSNDPVFTSHILKDGDIITCAYTDNATCTASGSVMSNSIKISAGNTALPSVSIVASNDSICAGAAVTFTAKPVNTGSNPSYQWTLNGVNTGSNEKVFTSSLLANNDIINCTITVDPLSSCILPNQVVSQNITMRVKSATVPTVNISASQNDVCVGENIVLNAVADNAGTNPAFQWILNNQVLANQSAVYTSNNLANGDRLFCRIIPGAGACSTVPDSSDIIVAIVNDPPAIYLSPADTIVARGTQVHLTTAAPANIVSFQWTPADKLVNPLSLSPQTTALSENASYTLTVTDDNGCQATTYALIKISTGLYIPNAFTPNNDGVNDVFRIPPSTALTLKEFSIYNRWGNRVFSTGDIKKGWDGTFNEKKQSSGVYIYYIRSVINNKEVFLKGSFNLVR